MTTDLSLSRLHSTAHLFVSWADYYRTIERLAGQIYDSGWRFDHVVCLARGGLRVGDVLSRLFQVPLAVLHAQSGRAAPNGDVRLSPQLAMLEEKLGERVLLVDDWLESGMTLAAARELLKPRCADLRTAVLWVKEAPAWRPDYWAAELEGRPWIHQPFEPYDLISIEELSTRSGRVRQTT